jgi:tryptophan 2,3-dioxygenase
VALDGGSEKPAATLTCEVCGRTFGKATSRYGHQRTHVITDKQAAILDALRAAGGVQSEAARTLALSTGSVNSAIATLRANGLLPADVEALVTKHAYRPKHELGPQTRQERGSAAERVAIHEVAERIKAREATPAQNEKTGETFEERRLRFARERVAAGRASF